MRVKITLSLDVTYLVLDSVKHHNMMKPIQVLEDIFSNQISVKCFAIETSPVHLEEAIRICKEKNYDIQLVKGETDDLLLYERATGEKRLLRDVEVISETTSIYEVLQMLLEYKQVFIKEKRQIKYIVTRADRDSIAVRIWLFGMISLFEEELRTCVIKNNINWQSCVSSQRLKKAQTLYDLKKSRNEEVDLLHCLQLIDFREIIALNQSLFGSLAFFNPDELTDNFNQLNLLRDTLAHSQKLNFEWEGIFILIKIVNEFLKG